MGRKAVGPVCCVMHVKEPRTLIVKEKGLAPVFLEWQLNAPKALSVCLEYNYMYRVMRIWTYYIYMEFAQYKCNIIIIIIIIKGKNPLTWLMKFLRRVINNWFNFALHRRNV